VSQEEFFYCVILEENISICTHMRSLEDELKEFRQERDEMRETIID
jgi:hypothetical protein